MPMDESPFSTSVFAVGVDSLALHPNPVACVVMGFGTPITVENDHEQVRGDVLVIRPGLSHRIRCEGGLKAMFMDGLGWSGADVVAERLKGRLADLGEAGLRSCPDAQMELRGRLSFGRGKLSPRMRAVLTHIAADPMGRMTQAQLSEVMGVERTHALRLFKAETGMTFRQFKRWAGLRCAAQRIAAGDIVRTAALDAGFADTAHLSRTFRQSFGLTPSQAIAGLKTVRDR